MIEPSCYSDTTRDTTSPVPSQQQTLKPQQKPTSLLPSIPKGTPLAAFHDSVPYTTWPYVTVRSKSVHHNRRIYFNGTSRTFVSDTLDKSGKVGVVEVIELLWPAPKSPNVPAAQFLLFDPVTGEALQKYPNNIQFQVMGIMGVELHEVPQLCLLCHPRNRPLIRVHESTPEIEQKLRERRERGYGMAYRVRTVQHIEDGPRGSIKALNTALDRTPDLIFDVLD